MTNELTNYESLSLIYNVAYDLSQSLERDYIQGGLNEAQIAVLSGSYSVVDWVANRIAELGLEEDECEVYLSPSVQTIKEAPKLMKALLESLADNLFSSYGSEIVDYKKVQALAGLQVIIPYLEEISRIIVD